MRTVQLKSGQAFAQALQALVQTLLQALRVPCGDRAGPWEQTAGAGLCDSAVGGCDGAGIPKIGLGSCLRGSLGLDVNPFSWGHSPPSPPAQASHHIYSSSHHS